ncbi:SH3 domain-containing protein [Clostridium oryzae]|uniref:SH3 domain of the SH3b1 type n=1 Tax=Clostridium oryzae TaxID=1450648 RepID=A0A1V4I9I3_9CLOT|nr:SH3 domain-containing protein [Clostridium oryzae]OPJ56544.1 SH3 domain of the SH3b1 type [Clostridium oryzae]
MYKIDCQIPEYMNSASFWITKINDADGLILSSNAISDFNYKISKKVPVLCDFDAKQGYIDFNTLSNLIESYKIPQKQMYSAEGHPIESNFYKQLVLNTNLEAVLEKNPIKYGITFKKTQLRNFPTDTAIYASLQHAEMKNFDRLQETGCEPCEALLLLHSSKDKKWYFVKKYNYYGWVKADDIAISKNRKDVFDYIETKNFLTVIDKRITISINYDGYDSISYGMGTKLYLTKPAASHSDYLYVKIPLRSVDGALYYKEVKLKKSSSIIEGYLPYTRANILSQAFKFLGTGYDWGDKNFGQDCSGFILAIYKSFGFKLPRNADEQEASFINTKNSIIFNEHDNQKIRNQKLDSLKPGAAIFKDGHVMMYLGKHDNIHYMIHSFAEYGVLTQNGAYECRTAMMVAISPVTLKNSKGVPFINTFTSCVVYE